MADMVEPQIALRDAFVSLYGEIGIIYPEDEWMMRYGIWCAAWNAAISKPTYEYPARKICLCPHNPERTGELCRSIGDCCKPYPMDQKQ